MLGWELEARRREKSPMPPARKEMQPSRRRQTLWRNSYWQVALIALCIGLGTILLSLTVDLALHRQIRQLYASDWLEALVAAALSGAALVRMQARRRELLVRMQIVEDVNHHVRNALTSIVYSASLSGDEELNARVTEACARVDWVLTEVLSQSIDAKGLAQRHPEWQSGRKL